LFSLFFPRPLFVLDAEEYHTYATNILEGRRFEVFPDGRPLHPLRPPMYPIFIAAVYFLFGVSKLPVYLSQIVLTGLISMMIYSLSFSIFEDRNSAFISSVLFSFHLPTLVSSAIYYPQALFSFCLILLVFLLHRAFKKPTAFKFLIAGFMMGIATLVKPVIQFLPLVIFPLLFFYLKAKRWRAICLTGLLIATYLATMTPWIIRNYIVYRTFIFCDTTGGLNLYTTNYILEMPEGHTDKIGVIPPMTEEIRKMALDESIPWPEKDKIYYKEAIKMIKRHPLKMIRQSFLRVINYYTGLIQKNILYNIGYPRGEVVPPWVNNLIVYLSAAINIIYLALAATTLLYHRTRSMLTESVLLLAVILYFTAIHSLSNAFIRYSIPIFPFIIIFAGHSISRFIFYRRVK